MRIGRKIDKNLSLIAPSGYSVEIDTNRCKSCGKCATVCAFDAILFNSGGDRLYDRVACMGCGLCTEKCEQRALSLVKDPDKGEPLDLDLVRETLG